MSGYPIMAYADSDGWACQMTTDVPIGSSFTFDWEGRQWTVSGEFVTPCCRETIRLVRRAGNVEPMTFHGIGCPSCEATYTVESHA